MDAIGLELGSRVVVGVGVGKLELVLGLALALEKVEVKGMLWVARERNLDAFVEACVCLLGLALAGWLGFSFSSLSSSFYW